MQKKIKYTRKKITQSAVPQRFKTLLKEKPKNKMTKYKFDVFIINWFDVVGNSYSRHFLKKSLKIR